ncbi:P-loop containing nucleoside triphosphate hydrolase protein [Clavulina sp. PMI_390]|nr:P-loop containing nucleoside triphosphate hydrolase protein [Clavulina sp. PMI_390]
MLPLTPRVCLGSQARRRPAEKSGSPKNTVNAARPSRFVSNEAEYSRPSRKPSTVPSRNSLPLHLRKSIINSASKPPVGARPTIPTKRADGFVNQESSPSAFSQFRAPPLAPGLLTDILAATSRDARPFPIQSLSMTRFFDPSAPFPPVSSQTLLASETGSGKSFAYLIPVIQGLKVTESLASQPSNATRNSISPRALVLAPTHELSRQLTSYAKALSHEVKLRTICLSNPPPKERPQYFDGGMEELGQQPSSHVGRPHDIAVGTPSKIAQMAGLDIETDEESPSAAAREKTEAFRGQTMSLDRVEWVVVDEADVLFDRDFRQLVHGILDAVSEAKSKDTANEPVIAEADADANAIDLPRSTPYNLILTTATIPSSLNTHLLMNFPDLVRLASPKLHKLPSKMNTERVDIKGMGNPLAVIHKKLLEIFANQARRAGLPTKAGLPTSSDDGRVILFCNQTKKAEEVGNYLKEKGVPALVMTGTSEQRRKGSNKHLHAFLTPTKDRGSPTRSSSVTQSHAESEGQPRILITTSLLARGLDFSPSVSHVLIVDEPRNEVDFLHRAGRTGRAGRPGTVVIFGKGIAPRKPRQPGFA